MACIANRDPSAAATLGEIIEEKAGESKGIRYRTKSIRSGYPR